MSRDFVIVIEADNKRSHAAYLKGLADLELIWPQIVSHATSIDAAEKKILDAEQAQYQQEMAAYEEAYAKHKEDQKAWEEHIGFFAKPKPFFTQFPPSPPFRSSYLCKAMERYESTRSELKHMADVAGAALGPYRMTEHQVEEMVGWEDGSRIERIKTSIAKREQRGAA